MRLNHEMQSASQVDLQSDNMTGKSCLIIKAVLKSDALGGSWNESIKDAFILVIGLTTLKQKLSHF